MHPDTLTPKKAQSTSNPTSELTIILENISLPSNNISHWQPSQIFMQISTSLAIQETISFSLPLSRLTIHSIKMGPGVL